MPLFKGSSDKTIGKNIQELHTGGTYAKTKTKFGEKKAQAQSIAIAMKEAGKSKDEPEKVDNSTEEATDPPPKKIGMTKSNKKIGYKPYTQDSGPGTNSVE